MSIESFRHKGLERLFLEDDRRGLKPAHVDRIRSILATLATAADISDMGLFPGWRLHPLKGNLKGFWSITVSGNWRIIFRFEDGKALDVDLLDYH